MLFLENKYITYNYTAATWFSQENLLDCFKFIDPPDYLSVLGQGADIKVKHLKELV